MVYELGREGKGRRKERKKEKGNRKEKKKRRKKTDQIDGRNGVREVGKKER